ncbi:MAG: YdcF family protein [Oricola sp.]
MFFVVSKIGWLLIQPVGLLALCFALTAVLAWRRAAKAAAWFSMLGLVLLLGAGHTNLGRLILQPLENAYPRPAGAPPAQDVAGVIVLGGGFSGHVTRARGGFELGESGDRFVEALRLARLYPQARIVVSGGEASLVGDAEGDAAIAQRFFSAFGIEPERILLEDKSLNTFENATLTKAMLPADAKGRWLLVTSAFHMPRSVGAFEKQGVPTIPWPVDFRTTGRENFEIGRDDPASAFSEVSLGMREWVGLAVYSATGRIGRFLPETAMDH